MKYKLIKEDKDEVIIEKSGFKHEFTVASVTKHIAELETTRKEMVAQGAVEGAKMINIEEFNKFILDMKEEDKHAVHLWYEAKDIETACKENIEKIDVALAEYAEVIEDVEKQTGIKI